MQDALLQAADDLVGDGIRDSGVPLTENLRHYLAVTLARYMRRNPVLDRLTLRVAQALDERAPPAEMRDLADACLLACSVFERRLRRAGGSLSYYSGLGRTAYDAAWLSEQAVSFAHMCDVVVAATRTVRPKDPAALLDAARAGSGVAREALACDGVLTFPHMRRFH